MFIHCELIILSLALALDGRVHSAAVIGGHEAVPHSRPYMAIVKGRRDTIHCGGFLLNKNFVMTAAHCQDRSYEVLLGVHDIEKNNGVQKMSVEQAFPHEGYNATTFENDIMLLKLSSEATFTPNVKPIALAEQRGDSLPKSCLISGWGRTSENDLYMSNVLMEANVTLINNKRCESENLYCSTGNKGAGLGDSGGPLVCEDGKAYGVMSHTYKEEGQPLIYSYAKIPDHKSWIYWTIKNAGKK